MITTTPNRKKTTLAQWIAEALNDQDYGQCTAISLQMVKGGGMGDEVKTTTIGGGRSWTAEHLATYFENCAQTYCQDIPGTHTFQLLAFFNNENQPKLKHPFLVAGHTDNHGLGTEPATPQGMQMQHMRHTEAMIQGMFQERAMLLDMPLRMIHAMGQHMDRIMQYNQLLQNENADAVRLSKEVILEQATKRREHDIELAKIQRSNKDREAILKLAPVLINELSGKEIIPQSTADTLLIEQIVDRLTPEMAEKMMGILPPEVMGLVMSRFNKVLEKRKEEHERALARGSEADRDADDDPHVLPESTDAKH